MSKPVVAIVGRPNVGKSAFFNRLIGKRISIVDDNSGVTRDRVYGTCEWRSWSFLLVDTGGLGFSDSQIDLEVRKQTEFALDSADVIVFVVDVKSGLLPLDEKIFSILKKSLKPVIVCVNKCDEIVENDLEFCEFYSLGADDIFAVSSIHGHGTGDLLDVVCQKLPSNNCDDSDDNAINVALIGKPNVGKSTLLNKIAGTERSIVSDIAGTTRDSVDMAITNEYGSFNFIDTAGIRRKNKIVDSIEKYSVIRTNLAIERSDVCVIMLDIGEEISEQDVRVAGVAYDAGKPCVICVNKCDIFSKNSKIAENFRLEIKKKFAFMPHVPVVFISAITRKNLKKFMEYIISVFNSGNLRIPTSKLNEILFEAMVRVPPPSHKGKCLKIYFLTQSSVAPPTFVFFVNNKELFHFSYMRFLENCIRKNYAFDGIKLKFVVREKRPQNGERKN